MLLFKTGIIGFITTLLISFMHNRAVEKEVSKKYETVDKDKLLENVVNGDNDSDAAVKPELN